MDVAVRDGSAAEPLDDDELVKRAQAGDREAMAELLDRHFDYVHHVCRSILRSSSDAEDAGQEALMQVARKIVTFQGKSAFRTWLHKVTQNVCLQAIREAARRDGRIDDAVNLDAGFDRRNTATIVATRVDVQAALDALPKPFRDVVVLFYFCDLEQDDIAEILGVKRVTVATRLHKAKEKLRPLLAESSAASVALLIDGDDILGTPMTDESARTGQEVGGR